MLSLACTIPGLRDHLWETGMFPFQKREDVTLDLPQTLLPVNHSSLLNHMRRSIQLTEFQKGMTSPPHEQFL